MEEQPTNHQLSQDVVPTTTFCTAEQILMQLVHHTHAAPSSPSAEKIWVEKWSNTYNRPYWNNIKTGEKSWHHPDRKRKRKQKQTDSEQKTSSPLPIGLSSNIPTSSQIIIANNDSSSSNEILVAPAPVASGGGIFSTTVPSTSVTCTLPGKYELMEEMGEVIEADEENEKGVGKKEQEGEVHMNIDLPPEMKEASRRSSCGSRGSSTVPPHLQMSRIQTYVIPHRRASQGMTEGRGGYSSLGGACQLTEAPPIEMRPAPETFREKLSRLYGPVSSLSEGRSLSRLRGCVDNRGDDRGGGMSARVERSRSRSRDRGWDRDDRSMCWRSQSTCLGPPQTIVITSVITFFFW